MTRLVGPDLDRQALILLCAPTSIGAPSVPPFGPAAWHALQRSLAERQLTPGHLLGMTTGDLGVLAGFTAEQANRVASLLARGGPVAIELERLGSRGLWITAMGDESYPPRLLEQLGTQAPPLLFGAGNVGIAAQDGLAIVGSRDADEDAITFTETVAASAVEGGMTVISGAARGIDAAAMNSALEHGGSVVGAVADALERRIREPQVRAWLADERLCLVTPYGTNAGFSVGAAMGRNKLIYGLSAFALVVTAMPGQGGTWGGATEALKNSWTNVFVRQSSNNEPAATRLAASGALPFPDTHDELTVERLAAWATRHAQVPEPEPLSATTEEPLQVTLFGEAEHLPSSKARKRKPTRARS